ncbi:MAG: type IV pilus modification PilV family protein [Acidobacteriota bacterium]
MEKEKRLPPGVAPARERGSSLIEVLIALMILFFLMIGVLQMFAMAYLVNLGSAARTEMTFKCEQVMENIRFFRYLQAEGTPLPSGTGFTFAAGTYNLPYEDTELSGSYWGPAQANVVDRGKAPYRLAIQVDDGDTAGVAEHWIVTVTATPSLDAGVQRYQGIGIRRKRVDYVAQIPK